MTNLTTRQKLNADPALSAFLRQTDEIIRWGAEPESTDEHPVVHIETWMDPPAGYIKVTYTEYQPDGD